MDVIPWYRILRNRIGEARIEAFNGDVDRASELMALLPNSERGEFLAEAFEANIGQDVFRELLRCAWDHDHKEVMKAAIG